MSAITNYFPSKKRRRSSVNKGVVWQASAPMRFIPRGVRQSYSTGYRKRNIRTAGYLGLEHKFFDTEFSAANIGAGMTNALKETDAFGLFCPQQGSGESGRDGRKCVIKSIDINGLITVSAASFSLPALGRYILKIWVVLDTQTNGAQLAPTDVFTDDNILSHKNLEHGNRFKILFARTIDTGVCTIHSDALTNFKGCGGRVPFKMFKRVNIPVFFDASTGAVTDITTNSIHLLVQADHTMAAGEPTCDIAYRSRCIFVG